MREARTAALVAALWLVSFIVDVVLLPNRNQPVVYVVPVVIAAVLASPRVVSATAVAVLLADLFSISRAHPAPDVWPITLVSLLTICALAIWIAIIRQRLARYARDQHRLAEAAEALVAAPTLDQAAEAIAEQAQRTLGVAAVQLWEVDEPRREWHLVTTRGITPETAAGVRRVPFDDAPLLDQLRRSGAPLDLPDLSTIPAVPSATRQVAAREAFRATLTLPLSANGRVVGAVSFWERAPRRFTPGDHQRVRPLGHLWALAIENARLHDRAVQSAREAGEAREQLQQFLGMVVHDLRGPLTTIRGQAQLLLLRRKGAGPPADETRGLWAIDEATRRMERLVGDLLDASRIGAGRFDVTLEPLNLAAFVRRSIERLQATTDRSLILDAPAALDTVADPGRLAQVLDNLLSNALKYSPPDSAVSIRVYRQGDEAVVSVADRGVGLAPEQIALLFQPFSRPNHPPQVSGVGLGLYLCKGIVEAMHGRIWVESAAGEGSTFSIALPVS